MRHDSNEPSNQYETPTTKHQPQSHFSLTHFYDLLTNDRTTMRTDHYPAQSTVQLLTAVTNVSNVQVNIYINQSKCTDIHTGLFQIFSFRLPLYNQAQCSQTAAHHTNGHQSYKKPKGTCQCRYNTQYSSVMYYTSIRHATNREAYSLTKLHISNTTMYNV